MQWIKSSFSGQMGNCVELANNKITGSVLLRNSRTLAVQDFTRDEIKAFLAGAKAGEFDHLV